MTYNGPFTLVGRVPSHGVFARCIFPFERFSLSKVGELSPEGLIRRLAKAVIFFEKQALTRLVNLI
jgi:hypothetical protein